MALDIIRENMDIERLVGEGSSQALVEGNVLVPGSGRDTAQVMYADGAIHIGSVEVQNDRVALDGSVTFTVLYTLGEEWRVRTMNASCAFSHAMDIPGAGPRMLADVSGVLEHVEAECVGGRMSLRAVAALKTRVMAQSQVACIRQVSGAQALETRSRTLSHLRKADTAHSRQLIREEFTLPSAVPALEALHAKTSVHVEGISVQDGRVVMSGEILLDTLYSTEVEGRPLSRLRHALPFEQVLDAPESRIGLDAVGNARVEDITLEVMFAQDETRSLRTEMVLACDVTVSEPVENTVLEDAYCASPYDVAIKTETVPVRVATHKYEGTDSIKANLTLASGHSHVGTVLSVFVRPVVSERSTLDGRTYVEGIFDTTLFYMTPGNEVPQTYSEETPFRAAYPFELADDAWLDVAIEEAEIIPIAADRLELKCSLRAQAVSHEDAATTLAVDAELSDAAEEAQSGITLYFAQPGDTLWEIAKRFRTTQEVIHKYNPAIGELAAGDRVLLYRKPAYL